MQLLEGYEPNYSPPSDPVLEPLCSLDDYERELLNRSCHCGTSSGIDGVLTRGTGHLDHNGFWEYPCNHTERGAD